MYITVKHRLKFCNCVYAACNRQTDKGSGRQTGRQMPQETSKNCPVNVAQQLPQIR